MNKLRYRSFLFRKGRLGLPGVHRFPIHCVCSPRYAVEGPVRYIEKSGMRWHEMKGGSRVSLVVCHFEMSLIVVEYDVLSFDMEPDGGGGGGERLVSIAVKLSVYPIFSMIFEEESAYISDLNGPSTSRPR